MSLPYPNDFRHSLLLRHYQACGITVLFMPLQIKAILKFLPRLRAKISFPPRFVHRLERAFYRHGWVDEEFDWPNWADAELLVQDAAKVAAADIFTVQKLLTTHIRKEHFCEGHFPEMIACGHLLEVLNRLEAIRDVPIYSSK